MDSVEGNHHGFVMEVIPPQNLIGPIYVPGKLLMGPGPSNVSQKCREAGSLHVLGHMHKEFFQILDDTKAGVQYLLQTHNAWSLVISGPGHAGMETVLCNLLEPNDSIVVGCNGLWGARAFDLASRLGATPYKLEAPAGSRFSVSEIAEVLQKHRPKVLFLVHAESSTGVLQPLEGIGELCQSYNCLLAVDAVASAGGVPFFMDKWKIDAVYTCSQKCVGAPPGLAPISFSARAVMKIKSRTSPIKSFLFDMNLLSNYWACNENDIRVYHHTPPTNLIYSLREALSAIATERLENIWQRHAAVKERFHNGLKTLGMQFFVENEADRSPTVTTLKIPAAVTEWKLILQYCMERHMVEIAGGLGPTAGSVIRIGLMGFNAYPIKVDRTLLALKEGLEFAKSHSKL